MRHARRAQEVLMYNNQSSEQPLGMQLSNEDKRRVRETDSCEKKDSD